MPSWLETEYVARYMSTPKIIDMFVDNIMIRKRVSPIPNSETPEWGHASTYHAECGSTLRALFWRRMHASILGSRSLVSNLRACGS